MSTILSGRAPQAAQANGETHNRRMSKRERQKDKQKASQTDGHTDCTRPSQTDTNATMVSVCVCVTFIASQAGGQTRIRKKRSERV